MAEMPFGFFVSDKCRIRKHIFIKNSEIKSKVPINENKSEVA